MPVAPPDRPLDPFVPTATDAWDLAKIGHLYRRAAFGASWKQLQAGLKQKPADLVDKLLDYDPANDPFNALLESLTGLFDIRDQRSVQAWWVHRALNSPQPLQEKIALFWHDHFATSAAKVSQDDLMHKQIELFRQQGLGSYRTLLRAIVRDPAMLVWLDGRESKKRKPNENFSREMLELFALGVGHYSETDVKELARCFTGYSLRDGAAFFNPAEFDAGEKTILGQRGAFNDEKAVDVLLAHPAAARHLARKLLFEFVHPSPEPALVDTVAAMIVAQDWEMKPVLRTLLESRLFFSSYAYRSRIKSPAELALGLAITMGGKIKTQFVRDQMNRMGQSLLYPPNVKGWDGHEAWINASTYLVRMNYGWMLCQQRLQEFAERGSLQDMIKDAADTPDKTVARLVDLLLDGQCSEPQRRTLTAYLTEGAIGKNLAYNPRQENSRAVRSAIRVITAMPEFQLA
jgi:uncharacterized protein (DUF1800 family)